MKIEKQDGIEGQIGHWVIEAFEGDTDKKIQHIEGYNRIVRVGKQLVLDLLSGDVTTPLTGIATGTNNAPSADGDTAITTAQFKTFEIPPSRDDLTTTYVVNYATNEGNINIQELGMLTSDGGTLFNRIAPIGPFNKTDAVSIRITVTITQQ